MTNANDLTKQTQLQRNALEIIVGIQSQLSFFSWGRKERIVISE